MRKTAFNSLNLNDKSALFQEIGNRPYNNLTWDFTLSFPNKA